MPDAGEESKTRGAGREEIKAGEGAGVAMSNEAVIPYGTALALKLHIPRSQSGKKLDTAPREARSIQGDALATHHSAMLSPAGPRPITTAPTCADAVGASPGACRPRRRYKYLYV